MSLPDSSRRVLILASNPEDTDRLALEREVREIKGALERRQGDFTVRSAVAARLEDLEDNLLDFKPEFVHFCGHGFGNRGIAFQDHAGLAHAVTTDQLEAIFGLFKAGIRCVFLNCCLSEPQAQAIAHHIGYVIGTKEGIGDGLAVEFAVKFYKAVGRGKTVPFAFKFARAVTADSPDCLVPILIRKTRSSPGAGMRPQLDPARERQQQELDNLPHSVTADLFDRCRLVFLVSPSNVSPSSGQCRRPRLAQSLRHELKLDARFQVVISESLEGRPTLAQTLSRILARLVSHRDLLVNGRSSEDLLTELLGRLKETKALICLEDSDAILAVPEGAAAAYQEGFRDYGTFFSQMAKTNHKGCLLLIGRCEPPELLELECLDDSVWIINLATASRQMEHEQVSSLVQKLPDLPTPRTRPQDAAKQPSMTKEDYLLQAAISHFWNRLQQKRQGIVVLGSGAAHDGQKEGEPYPSFEAVARTILADEGRNPETNVDIRRQLRDVLCLWTEKEDLTDFLGKYLSGEPGPGHYYLAALALALFPQHNILLFVTTGVDNLMEEAFARLQKGSTWPKVAVFRLTVSISEEELQQIGNRILGQVRKGRPVILKIFGDLAADSPMLLRRARIMEPLRTWLLDWFRLPVLAIGCGPEDRPLESLLLNRGHGSPVLLVGSDRTPSRLGEGRNVHHIPLSFRRFALGLTELLYTREKQKGLMLQIEALLQGLDPQALYPDCDSIAFRAELASRASLLRVEERLPRSQSSGTIRALVPIWRTDTQPNVSEFLQDERPLLAVVGDSGTGKSTFFYQFYKTNTECIAIFYDVHQLQAARSLCGRLARDFLCEERRLEDLFGELARVLEGATRRLLILIDGLNESRDLKPSTLRFEIESLGAKLPSSIKIAFSCRKVYWDHFVRNISPLPGDLYFGAREAVLGRFSPREAEAAFKAYQKLFHFRGTYQGTTAEFKQHLVDPLMLRLLAEGYQGRELPSFAPAVLIFEAYEQRLRRDLRPTVLPDFLDALVATKVRDAEVGPSSDQFATDLVRQDAYLSKLIQQQQTNPERSGDPLVLLEDEGVLTPIDEDRKVYRFSYDRFFEYLLGKAFSPLLRRPQDSPSFGRRLRQLVQRLSPLHFSFLQALKSEVIRLNIIEPKGAWSMYVPALLRQLLEDPDSAVASFTKDLCRELMFEGENDLSSVMAQVYSDEMANRLLLLDVAPDSPRTLPMVVKGLATGSRELARRCCHILVSSIADPGHLAIAETTLLANLRGDSLPLESACGLIYYSAALTGEADLRGVDPFPVLCRFWQRAITALRRDEPTLSTLVIAVARVIRAEGGRFFGDDTKGALDYIWTSMSRETKELALKMLPYVIEPQRRLPPDVEEILLFFGSMIRDWSTRHDRKAITEFDYKLEFTIAQWVLVQRVRLQYYHVKDILRAFVSTGYSRSIEVALSNMEACCLHGLRGNRVLLEDAYRTMLEWMPAFKQDEEAFYRHLDREDAFSRNECPIDMVGRVSLLDEFSPREGPVPFLVPWFQSPDWRDRRYALICARKLWRHQPVKVLRTLDFAASSDDETCTAWLEAILKEIYLIHPRLVEDFFVRNGNEFDRARIHRIKNRQDVVDPSAVVHPGEPLYKALFLGPRGRREKLCSWYTRLLGSSGLESFCDALTRFMVGEISVSP